MIELDGSYGEGGGSLVRVALALATFTGQSFKVNNIRSGRPQPGLKPQHLMGVEALKKMSEAKSNSLQLGSTELEFIPGKIKSGHYEIDIGTAGSITLLTQAFLLPCLFASGKVTIVIKGGTCGKSQASVDYLQNILLPLLSPFVKAINLKILKRGYYPQGGGLVQLEISPKYKNTYQPSFSEELAAQLPALKLTQSGQLEQVRGVINLSQELAAKTVGERIVRAAQATLSPLKVPVNIRIDYVSSLDVGGEILIWAVFNDHGKISATVASSELLEKNRSSEELGKIVAEDLIKEIKSAAVVDHHLADQLIQFLALKPGSEIKTSFVSQHTLTNIYVCEKFLPVRFKIDGQTIKSEAVD